MTCHEAMRLRRWKRDQRKGSRERSLGHQRPRQATLDLGDSQHSSLPVAIRRKSRPTSPFHDRSSSDWATLSAPGLILEALACRNLPDYLNGITKGGRPWRMPHRVACCADRRLPIEVYVHRSLLRPRPYIGATNQRRLFVA